VSAIYVARLAPLDRDIAANSQKRGLTLEHCHAAIFALERKRPDRVQVLLDHDERRVVGHLDTLTARDGWLEGTFRLDERSTWSGVAENRLKVGTPVSVCYTPTASSDWMRDGIRRMVCAELHEVSIVPRAAIPGAEIILKLPARKPKPTPASDSKPTTSVAAAPAPKPAPASASAHRTTVDTYAELQRRIDFAEANGHRADVEQIICNMKAELGLGGIERAWADHLRRRAA
jgi:hypothetical protein